MRRALHRSVGFWLGCFVLVFLLWVWVDSWKVETSLERMWFIEAPAEIDYSVLSGPHTDEVAVDSGRIIISWGRAVIRDPLVRTSCFPFHAAREPAEPGGEWFATPVVRRYEDGESLRAMVVAYRVVVPMWGIVGLYVMGCGGVMWWRRRRLKRFLLDKGNSMMEGVKG